MTTPRMGSRQRRFAFYLAMLSVAGLAQAQTREVEGTVVDSVSG